MRRLIAVLAISVITVLVTTKTNYNSVEAQAYPPPAPQPIFDQHLFLPILGWEQEELRTYVSVSDLDTPPSSCDQWHFVIVLPPICSAAVGIVFEKQEDYDTFAAQVRKEDGEWVKLGGQFFLCRSQSIFLAQQILELPTYPCP